MSDKNQSSPEVQNVIRDAKNLYGSVVTFIKKTIADYKTPAENKTAEQDKPTAQTPPSVEPPAPPRAPAVEEEKSKEQPFEVPRSSVAPESTNKDSENKQ